MASVDRSCASGFGHCEKEEDEEDESIGSEGSWPFQKYVGTLWGPDVVSDSGTYYHVNLDPAPLQKGAGDGSEVCPSYFGPGERRWVAHWNPYDRNRWCCSIYVPGCRGSVGLLTRVALSSSGSLGVCRSVGIAVNLTGPNKKAVGNRKGIVIRSAGFVICGFKAKLLVRCADVLPGLPGCP